MFIWRLKETFCSVCLSVSARVHNMLRHKKMFDKEKKLRSGNLPHKDENGGRQIHGTFHVEGVVNQNSPERMSGTKVPEVNENIDVTLLFFSFLSGKVRPGYRCPLLIAIAVKAFCSVLDAFSCDLCYTL